MSTHSDPNAHSDTYSYSHTYRYGYANRDTDCDSNDYAHNYTQANTNTKSFSDATTAPDAGAETVIPRVISGRWSVNGNAASPSLATSSAAVFSGRAGQN